MAAAAAGGFQVFASAPFVFQLGPVVWCSLTYGPRPSCMSAFSAATHATCSGLAARCSLRTLLVQNSALCHASVTCAAGRDMPISGPMYATKDRPCTASARAFWWLNASVRFPSDAAPTAPICSPSGVNIA